jgi:hypothetical protein
VVLLDSLCWFMLGGSKRLVDGLMDEFSSVFGDLLLNFCFCH